MTSFIDALYSKYCDDGSLDTIELPQEDGHRRICEYVGFKKVSEEFKNLANLRVIDLSNHQIKTLCDSPNFDLEHLTLKKAYSLNLTKNLLENWCTVSTIVELCPSLEELILSSNPLRPPTLDEINEIGGKLHQLKTIVLGAVHYTWDDFQTCSKLMPNIQNVNLFENDITLINKPDDCLVNLRSLSISHNPISKWQEICKLATCRLEKLELPYCKIDSIRFDSINQTGADLFLNLQYLDLSYNQINDWRSVAELNKLPALDTLLLKRNPLFDTKPYYHNFNFILGRIKNLIKLDREPVTPEVRNDAEKYYLRMIYLNYLDTENDPDERQRFLEENPRFLELLNRLGEPAVARKLTKEETIKKNFFKLKILDEQNVDPKKRIIRKQIPVSLQVSQLKFMLKRLLKIEMDQDFKLIVKSTLTGYEEEMEDRNEVLCYRFEPDAVIHVQRL